MNCLLVNLDSYLFVVAAIFAAEQFKALSKLIKPETNEVAMYIGLLG